MAPGIPTYSVCLPPNEAYFEIVKKGEKAAASPSIKVFHQAFVGGCYIGFGGLLSMVIGGQLPGADMGAQKFVFAALFPVNLLLILLTGGSLFTGNTAAMPAAVFEGKCTWLDAGRCLAVSWIGNFMAAAMFAGLTEYAELCPVDLDGYGTYGKCGNLAIKVVEGKVSKTWGQTFIKGIMCNWMVCMAVFLSCQAQDMTGKMVGIWFPISAFVMMGMEHSVANMFMLPLGLICGTYDPNFKVTAGDIFVKNMIPVCCGNFFAGCICVAASYSYAFGKLGQTNCGAKDNCSWITEGCDCMGEPKSVETTAVQPKVETTPAQSSVAK
jgi:formate/nitrite transporter